VYSSRVEWTPDEIRRRRHIRGLNQEELADLLGVSRSIINKWELGERHPGGASIRKLERELLDVSADEPTLSGATDVEFMAELARRLSRTAERGERATGGLPTQDLDWPRRDHSNGANPRHSNSGA